MTEQQQVQQEEGRDNQEPPLESKTNDRQERERQELMRRRALRFDSGEYSDLNAEAARYLD